jgi:hypothetical protein
MDYYNLNESKHQKITSIDIESILEGSGIEYDYREYLFRNVNDKYFKLGWIIDIKDIDYLNKIRKIFIRNGYYEDTINGFPFFIYKREFKVNSNYLLDLVTLDNKKSKDIKKYLINLFKKMEIINLDSFTNSDFWFIGNKVYMELDKNYDYFYVSFINIWNKLEDNFELNDTQITNILWIIIEDYFSIKIGEPVYLSIDWSKKVENEYE